MMAQSPYQAGVEPNHAKTSGRRSISMLSVIGAISPPSDQSVGRDDPTPLAAKRSLVLTQPGCLELPLLDPQAAGGSRREASDRELAGKCGMFQSGRARWAYRLWSA